MLCLEIVQDVQIVVGIYDLSGSGDFFFRVEDALFLGLREGDGGAADVVEAEQDAYATVGGGGFPFGARRVETVAGGRGEDSGERRGSLTA